MANITTDVGKAFLPTIWSKEILRQREKKLVLAAHVKRFDQDVTKMGDTVKVPRRALRTASTKAPGGTVTYVANSEGTMTINITTQAYDAFILEDIEKIQSAYQLMSEYTEGAGYAIGAKVDTDLFSLRTSVANTTGTASTTVRIAKTMITQSNFLLDNADAPQEDRYMTVDAYGYKQLLDLDDFIRYDSAGEAGQIYNGRIGSLYGLEILRTTNQPNASNISYSMVFQKDAIALAMQKEETIETEYSVDYIGTKVVCYNIYGFALARTDHIAILQYGIG